MPLALLLHDVLDVIAQATDHLAGWARLLEIEALLTGRAGSALTALSARSDRMSDWIELIRLEALLVRRVASAFLVHWFGSQFPMAGSALRIAISNVAALRARYAGLERSANQTASGLDIGVPLASMLGTAFGSLVINPTTLAAVITSDAVTVTIKLLFVVLSIIGALLPGLAPIAFLASPILLAVSPAALNEGYPLLLAVGGMLPALIDFMDALSANWESIIGPIVSLGTLFLGSDIGPGAVAPSPAWLQVFEAAVPLLDRLAVLLPILLNGLGLLILTLGPPMQSVAALLGPVVEFVRAAIDALALMFNDFVDQLKALVDFKKGPFAPLLMVLSGERKIFEAIGRELRTLLDPSIALLKSMWADIQSRFKTWWTGVKDGFKWLFTKHPTMAFINSLIDWVKTAYAVLAAAWQGLKVGIVIGSGAVSPALPPLLAPYLLKPSPASPPYFPDPDEIFNRLAAPAAFESLLFSPAAPGAPPTVPAELAQRQSIFAAERARLRTAAGSAEQQVGILHAQELQLRAFLFDVVARLLPNEARKAIEPLKPTLRSIDALMRSIEQEPTTTPTYPVKALPEVTRLRPVVHRLRVHGSGLDRADLETWANALRDMLGGQQYAAQVSG